MVDPIDIKSTSLFWAYLHEYNQSVLVESFVAKKNSFFLHCPMPTSRLIFSEWQARKFASGSVCKSICQSQDSDFYSVKAVVANLPKAFVSLMLPTLSVLSSLCCQLPIPLLPSTALKFPVTGTLFKIVRHCIDVRSNVIWARINDRKQIFNLRYRNKFWDMVIFCTDIHPFQAFGWSDY